MQYFIPVFRRTTNFVMGGEVVLCTGKLNTETSFDRREDAFECCVIGFEGLAYAETIVRHEDGSVTREDWDAEIVAERERRANPEPHHGHWGMVW